VVVGVDVLVDLLVLVLVSGDVDEAPLGGIRSRLE